MDAMALRAEEGRGTAPICSGEPRAGCDPEVSEWGNPLPSGSAPQQRSGNPAN